MEILDLNTTSAREHVGEIEKAIQYIKQRCLSVVKSLSMAGIKFLNNQIVVRMCYFVTIMVNELPENLGVSQVYSPREIMTQRKLVTEKDCKIQFSAYV